MKRPLWTISIALMIILAGSVVSLSLIKPTYAQSPTITLTTNKTKYDPGETIVASGTVSGGSSSSIISLLLIAPNGVTQFLPIVMPGFGGAYTVGISNYQVPVEGKYTLVAGYSGAKTQVTIYIGTQPAPEKSAHLCDWTNKFVCVGVSQYDAAATKASGSQFEKRYRYDKMYPKEPILLGLSVQKDSTSAQLQVYHQTQNKKVFDKTYSMNDLKTWGKVDRRINISGGQLVVQTLDKQEQITLKDTDPRGVYSVVLTVKHKSQTGLTDATAFELVAAPTPPPPASVGIYLKSGKNNNKDTIVELASNGVAISKFVMKLSPAPYGGLDSRGGGWTCGPSDSSGNITCTTGDPLFNKNKLFKFARQTLNSVTWEAYDTNGAKVGSGTAKRA